MGSRSPTRTPVSLRSRSCASQSSRTCFTGRGRTRASNAASSRRAVIAARPNALANFFSSQPTSCHQPMATGSSDLYRRESFASGLTARATYCCNSEGVGSFVVCNEPSFAGLSPTLAAAWRRRSTSACSSSTTAAVALAPCAAAVRGCRAACTPRSAAANASGNRPSASRACTCVGAAAMSPRRKAYTVSAKALPAMPAAIAHTARRRQATARAAAWPFATLPIRGSPPVSTAASTALP
mmetsp:Transcript_13907/g.43615  ORF Transcript_13907/g.43615 Transcript_13907/m.43615 type:complete len:240 (+) Transcript_13907:617-1336(+)